MCVGILIKQLKSHVYAGAQTLKSLSNTQGEQLADTVDNLVNMTEIQTPTTPSEWRARVFWLAMPIILSNITVPLVGIVDTAVMGRMPSASYLSATAIAATLFSSIYWVFGFLRMGTSGLVAQSLGANQPQRAERNGIRSIVLALVFGTALLIVAPWLFELGMWSMDVNLETYALAHQYFFIRMFSAPATLVLYSIIGILVGQQHMRSVFLLQLILNISNVVLTLVLFNLTEWNIRAVATATVISEYLAMICGLWMLRHSLQLKRHLIDNASLSWLWERSKLIEFSRIGGNLFIRTLCLTAAFYWLMAMSTKLGVIVLAVNAVLIQMLHFMAHALDGFAHAAETLVGHAYGKRDRIALSNAVQAATFWGIIFALMFTVVYASFGGDIFDAMATQKEVQNAARAWVWWVVLSPLVGVWSFLLDGIFTGTTHTREMRNGMIVSLTLFICASAILVPIMGNHGVWLSYYILMLARAATLGYWYHRIVEFSS